MPTLTINGREVELRREWWPTSGADRCAWGSGVAGLEIRGQHVIVTMRGLALSFMDFSDAHHDMVTILAAAIGEDRAAIIRAAMEEVR